MDRNLMKSINQIRNTARLDEIYQQSTAWIWTHVDEKVSRVTLFRVSQKRRLSKCCWSHDVPAKSPVAVAHSSQRPSWLKMIEPVSVNYLFDSLLLRKQDQCSQVMFMAPQHSILVRIFGLQQYSDTHLGHPVYIWGGSESCIFILYICIFVCGFCFCRVELWLVVRRRLQGTDSCDAM